MPLAREHLIASAALTAAALVAVVAQPSSAAGRSYVIRHPTYVTAAYTIKDVGGPPTTSFSSFSQPLGFNKTGQIVGTGFPATAPGNRYQHCIAWTGGAWVDIGGSTSLNCYATSGISDANANGVFATVGGTIVPTNDQVVGFYATVSPKSATLTPFSSDSPSLLYTMNASGLAAGYTYYSPFAGFATNDPTVTTIGGSPALLQPGCTNYADNFCMAQPYSYSYYSGQARSITASGVVLATAVNGTNGQFIEHAGGGHPTSLQFSLPPDGYNAASGVRGMDDSGNVVYYEYDSATQKYLTWTYSPSSKKAKNLGTLANSSCTQYLPLYVNGPGRVLGYTAGCSFASDTTYWTWDTTNGMVAVGFNHTGYSNAALYLINDAGQIAGDFTTATYVHHWAFLTPPTGKL